MKTPLNILIVEDEFLIAMTLKIQLERAGYQVCGLVAEGEKAVSMALSLHPDVILMDIGLKGHMDGIDAIQSIHIQENIPVIFVTGYMDAANAARAMQSKPLAYLSKPLVMAQLKQALEKCC